MFEMFMSKIKYDKDIQVEKLAWMTPGFTGADV